MGVTQDLAWGCHRLCTLEAESEVEVSMQVFFRECSEINTPRERSRCRGETPVQVQ